MISAKLSSSDDGYRNGVISAFKPSSSSPNKIYYIFIKNISLNLILW